MQPSRVGQCHVQLPDCCEVLWVRQYKMGRDSKIRKGLGNVEDGGSVAVGAGSPLCSCSRCWCRSARVPRGAPLLSRMVSIRAFLSLFLI